MPQRSQLPTLLEQDAECTALATMLVAMSATLEIAAKRFVREWIAQVNSKDEGFSSLFVKTYIKDLAELHPLKAAFVVEQAVQGCHEAHQALIEIIAEKTDRNEPLGAVLGAYAIRAMHPDIPRARGKSKWTNFAQDIMIGCLIGRLLKFFPQLKPTRSQIGRKLQPSACSIVADVLAELGLHRGSEKAIEKLWQRINPAVHTDLLWNEKP